MPAASVQDPRAGLGKVPAESYFTRGRKQRVAASHHHNLRPLGRRPAPLRGGGQEIERVYLTPRKKPPFNIHMFISERLLYARLCEGHWG